MKVFLAVAIVVGVLALGSVAYWIAEGRPGSPADFRARVEDNGLDIVWHRNGPRGGDGEVATVCGPVVVDVNELDGDLWLRSEDVSRRLSPGSIDALVHCRWPPEE